MKTKTFYTDNKPNHIEVSTDNEIFICPKDPELNENLNHTNCAYEFAFEHDLLDRNYLLNHQIDANTYLWSVR